MSAECRIGASPRRFGVSRDGATSGLIVFVRRVDENGRDEKEGKNGRDEREGKTDEKPKKDTIVPTGPRVSKTGPSGGKRKTAGNMVARVCDPW